MGNLKSNKTPPKSFNFSYDKKSDYIFDKNGYAIGKKDGNTRRSYDSKKQTLNEAVINFLTKKDNGFLYDVDAEVMESPGEISHTVDFRQDWDRGWNVFIDGTCFDKYMLESTHALDPTA